MSDEIDMDCVLQLKALMGEKYAGLVDMYLRSNAVHVKTILAGIDAGDAQAVVDAAHPMKSSGNMGLMALSNVAAALEMEAKNVAENGGDVDGLRPMGDEVAALFESGRVFLRGQI